ncbi:hypothetical protein B0I73DRAFT_137234 [Yarrowia lipolytica]|nr:hypothetical protein LXG23DRAFT_51190 [Yarrowia lipolytica]RDW36359.1 hypothetical protein B0I73DRAFT_137234 [Yarrowia lipolytica]RMI95144.1 hypothetical protein BD777DRAFT_130389 [Yarrowia lipolytica]
MGYSLTTPTPIVFTDLIPCVRFPQQVLKKASSISTLSLDFEPLDEESSYPATESVMPRLTLTRNNFLNASFPWREPSSVFEVKQERDHLSNLLALGKGCRAYEGHRKRFYVCHDRLGRCILVHNKNLYSAFESNLHNQQIVHVAILPSTAVIHVSSEEGVIEALISKSSPSSTSTRPPAECSSMEKYILWLSFGGLSIRVAVDWNANLECLHGNMILGKCSWSVGPSLGVFPMQGPGACVKMYSPRSIRFRVLDGSVSQTFQQLWLQNFKTGKTPDQWLLEAAS